MEREEGRTRVFGDWKRDKRKELRKE